MTEREYRQAEGISRSELWQIHESPEKYMWRKTHPQEATPALIFGQAAHKLLLEPETFADEFAVAPECDRRTKVGKQIWDDFCAESDGKTVIDAKSYQTAHDMIEVCLANPEVRELLQGEHEKPLFWDDPITGERCKARLDCLNRSYGCWTIIDYKTTTNAATEAFARTALNYGYDLQVAMYGEAVRHNMGEFPAFIFVVQEKEPPYAINLLQSDPMFIHHGRDTYRQLMDVYHQCKQDGNWYGYTGRWGFVNHLELPEWMQAQYINE